MLNLRENRSRIPAEVPPEVRLGLQLRSGVGEGARLRTKDLNVLKTDFLGKIKDLEIKGKDFELITDALEYGLEIHNGESRRTADTPYFVHPLRIATRLAEQGYTSPTTYAIALLHDVQENQSVTPKEIIKKFTPRYGTDVATKIAIGVHALSNEWVYFAPNLEGQMQKKKINLKSEDYLNNIYVQDMKYPDLQLLAIKTEDRFDNLLDYTVLFLDGPDDLLNTNPPKTSREKLKGYLETKSAALANMLVNRPDLTTRLKLATDVGRDILENDFSSPKPAAMIS